MKKPNITEDHKVNLSGELEEISKRVSQSLHKFEEEQIQKSLIELGWATPKNKKEMIDALTEARRELMHLYNILEIDGATTFNVKNIDKALEKAGVEP